MGVLSEQLRRAAESNPDDLGFTVVGQGELRYAEWRRQSSAFARRLHERGLAIGDRVALLTVPDDGLKFVVAYVGTHQAGTVAVPVNTRLSPPELGAILRHAEPAAVVVSPALRPLLANSGYEPRVLIDTDQDWGDALSADDSDFQADITEDDLAEILYTSGTTGLPKGVAIRHSNSAMVTLTEPTYSGMVWLHASPMFTFAGLTFVYQPMRMGMRTVYQPKFEAGEFLRLVEEHKVFSVFLVPAMAELLAKHDDFASADLSSVQLCSIGSAPVAPATLARLQERMPHAAVSNSYSMTEAGAAYCVLPKGELEKRRGSVGLPLPPTKIRIVREDGSDADPDEVGEVLVKPPGKQREYFRDPEASAEIWKDDWLHTGDLGKLDADGYLYIVGRMKDMIIRGGFNIYAVDIENVLFEHPDVREAAVVGVPHEVLGEDVAAFVVARDGASLSADDVIGFCKERLADYKVPRLVEFRDELPRNATGKVLKRELKPAG
jgi:acyl-CoA synthetase (AMP-forming)/AMP-acid ligase II